MATMEMTIFAAAEKIAKAEAVAATGTMIPEKTNQVTTVLNYSRWLKSLPLAD
jgi:hypothetical protein